MQFNSTLPYTVSFHLYSVKIDL